MLLRPVRGWIRPTALAAATTGIILFGMGSAGPGRARTRTQDPGASKIPQAVLSGLASGEEREVLVLLRDEAIEREAAGMRARAGIRVNNRAVLDFKSTERGRMKERVWSALRAGGVTVLRDYRHLPLSFVRIHSLNALRELAARPEVAAIYENGVRQRALAESLPLINQPPVAAAGHTGAGTTVAVLDTGCDYTRAAFGSCTAPGEPAGCRVVYADDFAPDDGMLDDTIYHGTNVSGIVLGVAPDAAVAALDVFNGNYGYDSDILAAINWSIDNQAAYNIVAMNLSLAGMTSSTICTGSVYATPFANAREAGILPVVAAGNDANTSAIGDPACAPGAVRVGAVYDSNVGGWDWGVCQDPITAADKVACFSNSADFLSVLAPGVFITAAEVTQQGTSQATPHVAGAVAVLSEVNPALTPDNIEAAITSTGAPILDPRNGMTFPRLDLEAAVTVSEGNLPPFAPSNPSPADQAVNVAVDATLAWTGGDPDTGDVVTYDVYFGTTSPPPPVAASQTATAYSPGPLADDAVYFWQVVARDPQGFTTEGPIWAFSTGASLCFDAVADGSFEDGTPNAFWAEESWNFGTPICDASCGIDGARTGDWFVWFGGSYFYPEIASLEQTVTLAGGSATLRFYLKFDITSGTGDDFVRVLMDDVEVFYTADDNPNYDTTYKLVEVDLSSFADGGSHRLRMESITYGLGLVTNFFIDDVSIETCGTSAAGPSLPDEVAADFGEGRGMWHRQGTVWQSLTVWNPEKMIAWQDKVAVDFGADQGFWVHDPAGWHGLTDWSPYEVTPWGDKLAAAFDAGRGLWLYGASGWSRLTSWEPDQTVAWGDKLAADFGPGRGLWLHDGAHWSRITLWNPSRIAAWGDSLVAAFAGGGLWKYDAGGWKYLTGWEPEQLVAWGQHLVSDFGAGRGLWLYGATGWTRISLWDAHQIAAWGDDLAVSFNPGGIYIYGQSAGWKQVTGWTPVAMEATAGAIVAGFDAGRGTFAYDGTGWKSLTGWVPEALEAVDLDGSTF